MNRYFATYMLSALTSDLNHSIKFAVLVVVAFTDRAASRANTQLVEW